MNPASPHTSGGGSAEARICGCGNKISSKDPHQVCSQCLGLEHARLAVEAPGSCADCSRFTMKTLRRRLARQASLSGKDPCLSSCGPPPNDDDRVEEDVTHGPDAAASWGSQADLATALSPAEDVLVLDYEDEDDAISELLISEEDDEDDGFFIPSPQAAKPCAPSVTREGGESAAASPAMNLDMQSVCKRAASRLNIPWPEIVAETSSGGLVFSNYSHSLLSASLFLFRGTAAEQALSRPGPTGLRGQD
ncbi:uncharacterized protein LOC118561200 [Fundulus heteroclitus]|uniref:uncharacterized protein LOC118561200 n=1 Tax=Fundulus heteroclitus TaxID=8078 RepID=UPI00165B6DBA|nr:uncharacterized protein LOC118561200 [Fundulus heteroclitus]